MHCTHGPKMLFYSLPFDLEENKRKIRYSSAKLPRARTSKTILKLHKKMYKKNLLFRHYDRIS